MTIPQNQPGCIKASDFTDATLEQDRSGAVLCVAVDVAWWVEQLEEIIKIDRDDCIRCSG